MTHLREEIRVEAPVEFVWELFCDVSHWKDWMPWGELSELRGPVDEVGTTYVHTMRLLGFEQCWRMTVVEVEPQWLYHEHSDKGPMDRFGRFEPDGDSTRLVFDFAYQMPGRLPGFFKDLMVKGWMQRRMRNLLEDFKATAETLRGLYPTSR